MKRRNCFMVICKVFIMSAMLEGKLILKRLYTAVLNI